MQGASSCWSLKDPRTGRDGRRQCVLSPARWKSGQSPALALLVVLEGSVKYRQSWPRTIRAGTQVTQRLAALMGTAQGFYPSLGFHSTSS